jgi:hypothetical protein
MATVWPEAKPVSAETVYGRPSRTDARRSTEVIIAARALNQMLELGRIEYLRIEFTISPFASVEVRNTRVDRSAEGWVVRASGLGQGACPDWGWRH